VKIKKGDMFVFYLILHLILLCIFPIIGNILLFIYQSHQANKGVNKEILEELKKRQ